MSSLFYSPTLVGLSVQFVVEPIGEHVGVPALGSLVGLFAPSAHVELVTPAGAGLANSNAEARPLVADVDDANLAVLASELVNNHCVSPLL